MSKQENFFDKVYAVAKCIPHGRVTSYGAIAKSIGAARSARMVGYAMNASGILPDVPAHRVVNRVGLLSGKHHFTGENLMQQLLESEGVKVVGNKVVNFEKLFWEPELGMASRASATQEDEGWNRDYGCVTLAEALEAKTWLKDDFDKLSHQKGVKGKI